jgi:dUTP pyrophosphatase
MNTNLDCYRLYDDATLPEKATAGSACFDISSYLREDVLVTVYDMSNAKIERTPEYHTIDGKEKLCLRLDPADRVLVPTGIIFKIPFGYSMRLHTRSSVSLKKGIIMPNGEGIIDSDYYHQTYVMLLNASADTAYISDKERIAQGELVQTEYYTIEETLQKPEQVTERAGGFGSTGVN